MLTNVIMLAWYAHAYKHDGQSGIAAFVCGLIVAPMCAVAAFAFCVYRPVIVPKLLIEFIALLAAAMFALVAIGAVSSDDNVAFFIALIGSMAVWEGVRFVLLRYGGRAKS